MDIYLKPRVPHLEKRKDIDSISDLISEQIFLFVDFDFHSSVLTKTIEKLRTLRENQVLELENQINSFSSLRVSRRHVGDSEGEGLCEKGVKNILQKT